ncbi:flavin reductase family protein [Celeribacter persicus]|uniref:Flavin reductase (NADH)/flavin reductase n=1 Tax=Celeribacter persicus TaxID=1651082 RepID=A0A2T5HUT0_9RHOB|nr:flavin reductase family protein [Celeribacter persicus]PTQ75326.1 flavin reductase (NADH)/flavin reductase [Celeribacter persicus]
MAITKELFRTSMALFPGAVTLITVGAGPARRGLTATAVCSLTDEPPSLLICVNRKVEACAEITRAGQFSVQLLAEDGDALAMRFAGAGGVRGAEKFAEGAWSEFDMGLPSLDTALASLACTVTSESDNGSHRVFIGRIEEARLRPEAGKALVYAHARFHRLQEAG